MAKFEMNSFALFAIIIVVGGLIFWIGGDNGALTNDASSQTCKEIYEVDLSGVDANYTKVESDTNEFVLYLEDDDLVSAEFPEFTVKADRIDDCRNADGTFYKSILKYEIVGYEFSNQLDSSDSTSYYTMVYVNDDDKYNVTVDGVEFATVSNVDDTSERGTTSTALVTPHIPSATILDKMSADDVDMKDIFKMILLDDEDNVVGSVTGVYMKN